MKALIVNPHAGRIARDPALVGRLSRLAGTARVFVTETLQELDRAAAVLARVGASRVVLCGGDGSFARGISALFQAGALHPGVGLTFLSAGTVGTVARGLGQPRELEVGLRRALASDARFEPRPSLEVMSEGRGQLTRHLGFIFGTGLVARFFERYYREGAGGRLHAARVVARVFAGSLRDDAYAQSVLGEVACQLVVDGRQLAPDAFSLILCSTLRDVGLGLKVCHRAGEDPARLHLVASALPPAQLGPQLGRALRGAPLAGGEAHFDALCREFLLQFPAEGAWVLDGELLHAARAWVRPGPRLSLLASPARRLRWLPGRG